MSSCLTQVATSKVLYITVSIAANEVHARDTLLAFEICRMQEGAQFRLCGGETLVLDLKCDFIGCMIFFLQ